MATKSKWDSIAILTDLEPDDVLAIHMLLMYFPTMIPVFIGVGEGDCCKLDMAYNMMSRYPRTNVTYGDMGRSETVYPKAALEVFGTSAAGDSVGTSQFDIFVFSYENPLIICLMPPRTMLGKLYAHADLAIYGSFNFRALTYADPDVLADWLNTGFKSVLLYETVHALGSTNSINMHNAKEVFEYTKTIPGLDKLIEIWNNHIYSDKLDTINSSLHLLEKSPHRSWDEVSSVAKKMNRHLKIIMNVAEGDNKQMVAADFGLVLAICGFLDDYIVKHCRVAFHDDGYTKIIREAKDGRVSYVCGLTIERIVSSCVAFSTLY